MVNGNLTASGLWITRAMRVKSDKVYDLVVIGDEPAGLWCLRRIQEVHDRLTRSRHPKIPRFAKPNLGWISAGRNHPVAIPTLVAKQFGIRTPYPWSFEIATPKRTFLWDKETIQKMFPEISIPTTSAKPSAEMMSALRYVLRTHPEILGYASGIWRFFGAAEPISPERMIWASLLCHSLCWWDAGEKLDSVDALEKADSSTPFLSITADKNWKIEWEGKAILAKSVLWNTAHETETASAAEFPVVIPTQVSALPSNPSPLILYFDTEEIPEARTEVWPFEISVPRKPQDDQTSSVRFWIRDEIDASSKNLTDRMHEGVKRAQHLFPYLDVKSASLKEDAKLRRFPLSTFSIHDPGRSRVYHLPPSHLCHLTYPLGTLKGAREVLHAVLGRTKMKWARKEASAKAAEL